MGARGAARGGAERADAVGRRITTPDASAAGAQGPANWQPSGAQGNRHGGRCCAGSLPGATAAALPAVICMPVRTPASMRAPAGADITLGSIWHA